jgi:hypothetical protein
MGLPSVGGENNIDMIMRGSILISEADIQRFPPKYSGSCLGHRRRGL